MRELREAFEGNPVVEKMVRSSPLLLVIPDKASIAANYKAFLERDTCVEDWLEHSPTFVLDDPDVFAQRLQALKASLAP